MDPRILHFVASGTLLVASSLGFRAEVVEAILQKRGYGTICWHDLSMVFHINRALLRTPVSFLWNDICGRTRLTADQT